MTQFDASTLLKYSPRKARLIIDIVRGMKLSEAMDQLALMKRPQAKYIYKLLKNAANNLEIQEDDYKLFKVGIIQAEDAQRLYRVVPRARGSAFRIRRRYSTVKVALEQI